MRFPSFSRARALLEALRSGPSIERVLAFVGAASAVTGLAQFVVPSAPDTFGPWVSLAVLGVAGAILGLVRSRRPCLVAEPVGRDWTIEVRIGDLFEHERLVVTADRQFSVGSVGAASLMGQFLDSLAEDQRTTTEAALLKSVAGGLADPGTVVTLQLGRRTALVVALSTRVDGSPSETTWADLSLAYIGLWRAIGASNLPDISVPLVGAGFAGAALDRKSILGALLISYHSASVERVTCPRLSIMLPARDAGLIDDADQLLRAIGYRTHRSRR